MSGNVTSSSSDIWDLGSWFQTMILDIGAFAIILYAVQYIVATYCCLSAGHQLLIQHLLPLQIYAEDARTLIASLVEEAPDSSVGAGKVASVPSLRSGTTKKNQKDNSQKIRLQKLVEEYDSLVSSDTYCHVKLISRTGQDACCCFTLRDGDLCSYVSRAFTGKARDYDRTSHYERVKYSKHPTQPDTMIQVHTVRWRSNRCLFFQRMFYCCANVVTHKITVRREDVFFGKFEPLVPARHDTMHVIDLDKGAPPGTSRLVLDTGRSDAWHNFSGWWKTWDIENLKNAFKSELDVQNIAREFKIKF